MQNKLFLSDEELVELTGAKRNGIDYQALLGHTKRDMSDRYVKSREVDRVTPNRKL